MPFGSEIARLYVGIAVDHGAFDAGMSAVDRRLVGTANTLSSLGTKLTVGLTAPMIYAGLGALDMAKSFDKAMHNVNTLLGLPHESIVGLRNDLNDVTMEVRELAKVFPQTQTQLAEGLYFIASAGYDTSDSLDILRVAAQAASAGLTDTETSSRAIISTLQAYGLEASDAGRISDILFESVFQGVYTFEQLSNSIGRVIPNAAQLKIPFEDVNAAIVTMSRVGLSADKSVTGINQAMTYFLKPGKDLEKQISKLGYANGSAMLEALGFHGSLMALSESVGGSDDAMARMFPHVTALRTALFLTSEQGAKTFTEQQEKMRNATGATSEALLEQAKSLDFQARLTANAWREVGLQFFDILKPGLIDATERMRKLAEAIQDLTPEQKKLTIAAVTFFAVLGPGLIVASRFIKLLVFFNGVLGNVGKGILFLAGREKFLADRLKNANLFLNRQSGEATKAGRAKRDAARGVSELTRAEGALMRVVEKFKGGTRIVTTKFIQSGKALLKIPKNVTQTVTRKFKVVGKLPDLLKDLTETIKVKVQATVTMPSKIPGQEFGERIAANIVSGIAGAIAGLISAWLATGGAAVIGEALMGALTAAGGAILVAAGGWVPLLIIGLAALGAALIVVFNEQIGQLIDWFWSDMLPWLNETIVDIVGELPSIFGGVLGGISAFMVKLWVEAWAFLLDLPFNLLAIIGDILGPVVDAFATFADDVVSNVGGAFEDAFNAVHDWLAETTGAILTWIGEIPGHLTRFAGDVLVALSMLGPTILTVFIDVGRFIDEQVRAIIANVQTWIGQIPTIFTTAVGEAFNFVTVTLPQISLQFFTWIGTLPTQVIGWLTAIVTAFTTWIGGLPAQVLTWVTQIATDFFNAISPIPGNVLTWLTDVVNTFTTKIGEILTALLGFNPLEAIAGGIADFIEGWSTWWDTVLGDTKDKINDIVQAVVGLPGRIIKLGKNILYGLMEIARQFAKVVTDVVGKAWDLGWDIVGGIVDGIQAAPGRVADAITGAVGGAFEWAKDQLGIDSPSKVAAKVLGLPIGQGVAVGILQATDPVRKAMEKLTDPMRMATSPAFASAVGTWEGQAAAPLPGTLPMYSGGGAGGAPMYVNVTVEDHTLVGMTPSVRRELSETIGEGIFEYGRRKGYVPRTAGVSRGRG